jgi:hypothetical protein
VPAFERQLERGVDDERCRHEDAVVGLDRHARRWLRPDPQRGPRELLAERAGDRDARRVEIAAADPEDHQDREPDEPSR